MLDLHQRRKGTIDAWFEVKQDLHDRFQALHETILLLFFQWVYQPNLKWKVDKAQCLVVEMLTLLKYCSPRCEGCGWKIPKFHLWCLMLRYVKMFGSASVFDGSTGERFLKSIVKDLVRKT